MEHSETSAIVNTTQPLDSEGRAWSGEPVSQQRETWVGEGAGHERTPGGQRVSSPQQAYQHGWEPYAGPQPQVQTEAPPKRPARSGSYKAWIALSVLVVLAILMAAVQAAYKLRNRGADLPPSHSVVAPANSSSGPSPNELSNTFRAVAKAVKPAVVYIDITETLQQQRVFPQFPGFETPDGGTTKQQASGSGFIVKDDGYIITNYHVVGKADKIEVTLADGRKFRAKPVGNDPESDLAVIKIDASSLPTAVLGDSDSIEQGDWVLAIGSPFGLQQTITAGIISATGRILRTSNSAVSQLDRFIQTDASINPGNSGGPLVNMNGEVVGINTLIYSPNNGFGGFGQGGGNVGIGFAIPSNQARQIYGQLVKSGKVSRGYLGVLVGELDEAKASALGVDLHAGALVGDIADPNGPAAKAGLKSGDVITAVDGKEVHSATELTEAVVALPVGHSAKVDFIRDGKRETVYVLLAERPANQTARAQVPDESNEEGDVVQAPKLGLTVSTVTPDIASQMKLRIQWGAVVASVDRNGPAGQAGISRGDVIHRIGRTEVKSAHDLAEAAKSLKSGTDVMVQVEHRGSLQFVTLSID